MQPSGIIWAGLQVRNLGLQVGFFRDVVGMRLIRQAETWAVFDAGQGALFELSVASEGGMLPEADQHQSLVVGFRVKDLPGAVQQLREKGVQFTSDIESYKSTSWVKFIDPEGNIHELKEVPG